MKDEYKEMVCRVRFIDGVPAKTYLSDVEIVRCNDCKYYLKSDEKCQLIDTRLHFYETNKRWAEDSFCAWAERKQLHG